VGGAVQSSDYRCCLAIRALAGTMILSATVDDLFGRTNDAGEEIMATEQEIIDILKNLRPTAVSIDEQGRIVIKDEEAKKRLERHQV
jgi:translation initiation factor 2 beta subunit (eIF-2beta)/eIF-5